jgi:hypothetical protein
MPEVSTSLDQIPEPLRKCPWHGEGVTACSLEVERIEGAPIFPLVFPRTCWVYYACGCDMNLYEDRTAARQRAMGIRP